MSDLQYNIPEEWVDAILKKYVEFFNAPEKDFESLLSSDAKLSFEDTKKEKAKDVTTFLRSKGKIDLISHSFLINRYHIHISGVAKIGETKYSFTIIVMMSGPQKTPEMHVTNQIFRKI